MNRMRVLNRTRESVLGSHVGLAAWRGATGLSHDRADKRGVEFQAQAEAEVGPLPGCLKHMAHEGQLGCDEQIR